MTKKQKLLQIIESNRFPFSDIAKHYAVVFDESRYEVVDLYLSGSDRGLFVNGDKLLHRTLMWGLEDQSSEAHGLRFFYRLVSLLRIEQFDVVICHDTKTLYSLSLARRFLRRFELVGVVYNIAQASKKLQQMFLMINKDKVLLLTASDQLKHRILKTFPYIPADRVQTCYPGLDFKRFKSDLFKKVEARDHLHLDQNDFLFANVEQVESVENRTTLLKSFALLSKVCPNAKLVFMGSEHWQQSISIQARQLFIDDKLFFHDTHALADVYLKAFDAIIWTSDKQDFNLSLLASMASGVPIVAATGSGATSEILGNTASLFKENDVYQLAYQIQKIYELSLDERQNLKKYMYSHLKHHFSARACRKKFWSSAAAKSL